MHSAMEQRYWMWTRRRFDGRPPLIQTPIGATRSYGDESWEERAFADDSSGRLGGCVWPPRSYLCSFCRREFRSAQALGGHMNVHRRDRARLKQSPPPTTHIENNNPFHHHQTQVDLNPSPPITVYTCPTPTPNPNLGVVAPHVNSFPPKTLVSSSPKQNSLEHFNFDRFSNSSTKIHNDRKRSFLDTKDLQELELGGTILRLGDGVRYENFIEKSEEEDDAIRSGKMQKTSATHSFFGSDSIDSDHLGSKVLAGSNSPTEELDLELKLG